MFQDSLVYRDSRSNNKIIKNKQVEIPSHAFPVLASLGWSHCFNRMQVRMDFHLNSFFLSSLDKLIYMVSKISVFDFLRC